MKFCSAAVTAVVACLASGAVAAPAGDNQAVEQVAAVAQHRHSGRDMQWIESVMDQDQDDEAAQQSMTESDDENDSRVFDLTQVAPQREKRDTPADAAKKVQGILTRFLLDGLRTVDSSSGQGNVIASTVDGVGLKDSLNGARATVSKLGLAGLSDATHLTSDHSAGAGAGALDAIFKGEGAAVV
ncbi:hypothetical protein HIM_01859 [Hirsutella minnesotensis 3608]|nr:hypothetical protein HIM_01859 [Hirsutella minnesotensis 3608]